MSESDVLYPIITAPDIAYQISREKKKFPKFSRGRLKSRSKNV